MLSEEEKQAIEFLKKLKNLKIVLSSSFWNDGKFEFNKLQKEQFDIILNLINKQQEEIEKLKIITNQYQAYKVNGYGKDTIAFASKKYFDNGSFREAPSIDELEDLQNQIAELKDKLDTKDEVIDKMAEQLTFISIMSKEKIISDFYKEIENE